MSNEASEVPSVEKQKRKDTLLHLGAFTIDTEKLKKTVKKTNHIFHPVKVTVKSEKVLGDASGAVGLLKPSELMIHEKIPEQLGDPVYFLQMFQDKTRINLGFTHAPYDQEWDLYVKNTFSQHDHESWLKKLAKIKDTLIQQYTQVLPYMLRKGKEFDFKTSRFEDKVTEGDRYKDYFEAVGIQYRKIRAEKGLEEANQFARKRIKNFMYIVEASMKTGIGQIFAEEYAHHEHLPLSGAAKLGSFLCTTWMSMQMIDILNQSLQQLSWQAAIPSFEHAALTNGIEWGSHIFTAVMFLGMSVSITAIDEYFAGLKADKRAWRFSEAVTIDSLDFWGEETLHQVRDALPFPGEKTWETQKGKAGFIKQF